MLEMMAKSAPDLRAIARLVLLSLVAALLLTWWAIGDISEPGGSDYLLRISVAQNHAAWFGLAGFAVAAAVAADAVLRWRAQRDWRPLRASLLAAGIGVVIGAGLRVVTARAGGANIGGRS